MIKCKNQIGYWQTHKMSKISEFISVQTCIFKVVFIIFSKLIKLSLYSTTFEPRHEKTNILHMRKQGRRSASR